MVTGRSIADKRLELLRATVLHAMESTKYYAEAYGPLDGEFKSLRDFQKLPLLDPETLTARSEDILSGEAIPEFVGITSGSTFGTARTVPLLNYRSRNERRTLLDVMNLLESRAKERYRDHMPLVLQLLNANHGLSPNLPQPGCFTLPLEKYYHFVAITSVLKKRFNFSGFTERVQILLATTNQLRLLTLLCMEHQINPDDFRLGLIGTGGWQVTSRWRELLEGYWRVPVLEYYGLGEVPGLTAWRHDTRAPFRLSPVVAAEVVGLHEDQPLEKGIGRLIVTALYPMCEAQPIIRYDTGDIVKVEATDATGQIESFWFVGRKKDTVFANLGGAEAVVLSPMLLNDILDAIPDIGTRENPRARNIPLKNMFGWQKYRMVRPEDGNKQRISLEIELRWSPSQFPTATRDLKVRIRNSLYSRSHALEKAVSQGQVELAIEFFEPGSTDFAAVF